MARKHAGGTGAEGFAISLPILFEKSGAEGTYRRFKFEILKVVKENALPGYHLAIEAATKADEPLLRTTRREMVGDHTPPALPRKFKASPQEAGQTTLPFRSAILPEATIQRIQSDFPARPKGGAAENSGFERSSLAGSDYLR